MENRVRAAEVAPVCVSEEGGVPSDDVGLTALSKRLKEESMPIEQYRNELRSRCETRYLD